MKTLIQRKLFAKVNNKEELIPLSWNWEYDYAEVEQFTDYIHSAHNNFDSALAIAQSFENTYWIKTDKTFFRHRPYITVGWKYGNNTMILNQRNFKNLVIIERIREWEPTLEELYANLSAKKAKEYLLEKF